MTEKQLKEMLRVLKRSKAEIGLLESQGESGALLRQALGNQDARRANAQVRIIISSISILNEKEWFVIENHLVNQKTWEETMVLFEKQWGAKNSRCTRTLMRMQHRALQKMGEFIGSFQVDLL